MPRTRCTCSAACSFAISSTVGDCAPNRRSRYPASRNPSRSSASSRYRSSTYAISSSQRFSHPAVHIFASSARSGARDRTSPSQNRTCSSGAPRSNILIATATRPYSGSQSSSSIARSTAATSSGSLSAAASRATRQHFLNLRPLPHGQGSLRPTSTSCMPRPYAPPLTAPRRALTAAPARAAGSSPPPHQFASSSSPATPAHQQGEAPRSGTRRTIRRGPVATTPLPV